ncbi:hypothetical protein WDU94_009748 [Cyamophila willieti]
MINTRYAVCAAVMYHCMTVSAQDFQSFEDPENEQHSPEHSDEVFLTEGTTANYFMKQKTGYNVPFSEEEGRKRSKEIYKCKFPNCFWQGTDALEQDDHERQFHEVAEAPQLFQRESVLDEETFQCRECKQLFYQIADLEDHLLEHEENRQMNIFGDRITTTTLPPFEDIDLELLIRSPSGKYLYCPLCSSKLYPFNFERHYRAHLKRGY